MESLETYRRKRNFSRTPEPRGKKASSSDQKIFVVQKHRARRLHYDLRLEVNGVLKSWALPKGPSMNSKEKRLAVQTEDHPLDYAKFEGEIPKGEYGGGRMEIWDHGEWIPEEDPRQALRDGKLRFRLNGTKLNGVWNLIRTSDEKNWLLLKSEREKVVKPEKKKASDSTQLSLKTEVLPPLQAQLAVLKKSVPEGDRWIHEIKFDGYRLLLQKEGSKVKVVTRNQKDWTSRLPWISAEMSKLSEDKLILDGELVYLTDNGKTDFQKLQNALKKGTSENLFIYIFDILYANGKDLRRSPLSERKKLLASVFENQDGRLRVSTFIQGQGQEFYQQACSLKLEGIVSKDSESVYHSSRHPSWQKIKCGSRQEFVIGGYTEPGGSRRYFGSVLVGYFQDGRLHYAGKVGTGFSSASLKELHKRFKALSQKHSPFEQGNEFIQKSGVHWLKPELLAEVSFTERTDNGLLRHPSFQGLREDKDAEEVGLEEAKQTAEDESAVRRGIRLTHPNKILYPKQGITKSMLAAYYEKIEDWMIDFIRDRPLSLVRCPSGSQKECFFQRHLSAGQKSELPTFMYKSKTAGKVPYCYVRKVEDLISLVQLGVLELHQWGCRIDRVERPDQIVFDLDPDESLKFERVMEAAKVLREFLAALSLESFVRSTGGKGLHVVVPIRRTKSWDEVKSFAQGVAQRFEMVSPKHFTSSMSKKKREKKIFVDYFRNSPGNTSIALFSARAKPQAPVACPLFWEQLDDKDFSPQRLNVQSVLPHIETLSYHPWKEFLSNKQSLTEKMIEAVTT